MIEYQDIENTVLEKGNMGGIWENVYFAPKADFESFAEKPSHNSDRKFSEMNKLMVGTDKLKPGKKLYKAYSTMEKGSLTAERQGEIDGVSHKISLKLFTPGLESESLAMLQIPNQNWIFYVKSGEQMFRVGGEKFAAKLAPEGNVGTGDTTAAAKGNELTFFTYDDGFAGEVVDIAAIEAMLIAEDPALTLTFNPAHGDTLVAVDAVPTITASKAFINADTMQAFTNQEVEEIISLVKLDIDGNVVAIVNFTGTISGNAITVTPAANFDAASIYQIKIDNTKLLASDTQLRASGSNYARFTTA